MIHENWSRAPEWDYAELVVGWELSGVPSMTMSAQEARTLLDLQPGYEKADLASAYRRLVRSVHPDLLVGSSEQELRDASDLLSEANLANEVLRRSLRINATDLGPLPSDASCGPEAAHHVPSPPVAMPRRHWNKLFSR